MYIVEKIVIKTFCVKPVLSLGLKLPLGLFFLSLGVEQEDVKSSCTQRLDLYHWCVSEKLQRNQILFLPRESHTGFRELLLAKVTLRWIPTCVSPEGKHLPLETQIITAEFIIHLACSKFPSLGFLQWSLPEGCNRTGAGWGEGEGGAWKENRWAETAVAFYPLSWERGNIRGWKASFFFACLGLRHVFWKGITNLLSFLNTNPISTGLWCP